MYAGQLLRRARVVVALAMLALATLVFLGCGAAVAKALQWVSAIQIVSLILAQAVVALVIWFVFTTLFGRVYCSWLCPLGTLQDCVARLRRPTRRTLLSRRPYRYAKPQNALRYSVLAFVLACDILGLTLALTLTDPYQGFGTIVANFLSPLRAWLMGQPAVVLTAAGIATAAVTLTMVAALALWRGRLYCNTICPVGSLLGLLSYDPVFHFDIDTDICTHCGLCEKVCKAQCINLADKRVDSTRCVVCFDCVDICHDGALRYTTSRKTLSLPMMQKIDTAPTAYSKEER